MKKILSVLLSISIIIGVGLPSGTAFASDSSGEEEFSNPAAYDDYFIPIVVEDGSVTQREQEIPAVNDGGEILVDVTALEGADVDVSVTDGSAYISSETAEVTLVADSDLALVDSGRESLGADVVEQDGVLYAPLDDMAELCGLDLIEQDGAAVYCKPYQTMRLIVKADGRIPDVNEISKSKNSLGYTVLDFASQQDTQTAYDVLSGNKNVISVNWENVYYAEGFNDSDMKTDTLSWGADYIGSPYVINYAQSLVNRDTVTVAIVDTGVDSDHPFLEDRLSLYTKPNVEDVVGHGTHCAGIVVDNTPDNVEILPVKGLTSKSGSGSDSDLAEAVNYAVSCNADVISMSFGGRDINGGGFNILKDALKNAYDAGCILVASAGNETDNASKYSPANLPYCITVAATDKDGKPANFSNYGECVDVAAPGVSIYSSYLDGGYKNSSGTSMATPFVSAACATDITINGKKTFDEELKTIKKSVTRITENAYSLRYNYGTGIISFYGFLNQEMVKPVKFSVPSGSYDEIFEVSLSCDTAGAQIYYLQSNDESVLKQFPSPDNASLYTEPIVISGNSSVVAAAYCDGMLCSDKSAEAYIFNDFDFEENYIVDENGCLTAYTGDYEILSVPEYVNGIRVTSVGENAFKDSNLISINLPDSVTTLGKGAFDNCRVLEHITANSVTEISDNCFDGNYKLSSLNLGTLVKIGNNGFNFCPKLNENNLDLSSVEYVGDYGLYKTGFTYLELYNIKYFGEYSFAECFALESVVLPNVKVIQSRAFRECTALKSVTLESVLQLDDAVFRGCKNLTDIYAPNLQVLGDSVFSGCQSLVSADFSNVEQIGSWAFSKTGFTVINLPKVTQTGYQVFSFCENLMRVNMPAQDYIPAEMFVGCTSLTHVPGCYVNAKEVGWHAFKDCTALVKAELPKATVINQDAFIGATALNEIILTSAISVFWQQIDSPSITSLDLPSAEAINGLKSSYLQSLNAPSARYIGGTSDCKKLTEINAPSLLSDIVNPYQDMDVTPDGKTVIKPDFVTVNNCNYNPFEERTIPQYKVVVNDTLLTEGEDYTITFANNNVANKYFNNSYYIVEGIGDYAGIVTGSFRIYNYSINNLSVVPIANQQYNGKLHLPQVSLVDQNGNVLDKGFSVKYSDNLNAGPATVTVTGLSRNGYTTDIASVTGTVSTTFKIVAQAQDIDAFLDKEDYAYTGSQICPKPIVSMNGKVFAENEDYTLSYGANKNLGKGTVYINFIGEYCTGSKVLEFNIVPAPLDASLLSLDCTEFSHTGKEIKPNVVSSKYKLGTDYTVEYINNINRGTGTVIVTGIGNYTDTVKLNFKINYYNKWALISGKWYYYNSQGRITVGWAKVGSYWYYFDPSGAMVTGRLQIDGKWYFFNNSGAMQTGWQTHNGYWYFYSSSGAMAYGWVKSGGKWYYLSQLGVMQTGWAKVGSAWYYFASLGAMQTGWQKLSGVWYYFDSSGAMHLGWLKSGGKWYYFNSSGAMVTGKQKINGKRYTFDSSGALIG